MLVLVASGCKGSPVGRVEPAFQAPARAFVPGATTTERFTAALAVMKSRCVACHDTDPRKFDFDNERDFIRFGWVVPGHPESSKLILRTLFSGGPEANMPKRVFDGRPFERDEFDTLFAWVKGMEEPDPGEIAGTFQLSRSKLTMLPFPTLIAKLRQLLRGQAKEQVAKLLTRRFELGDFAYSQGIGAEESWTAAKIEIWIRGMNSICASKGVKLIYPYPAAIGDFVQRTLGRAIGPREAALIESVENDASVQAAQKFDVICTSLLSSAEFVSL